ncbi:MAG: sodium-independent anion transporter, partial [Lachnospiraceae bacterium]|nr:sodium-independent anion transporter [Lachnospiraceae bacterium]
LFMKRMSDTASVTGWKYIDDEGDEDANDKDAIGLKRVPKNTLVYEIMGPMFFAATDIFLELNLDPTIDCIVLRMRAVPAMDASALHTFFGILDSCNKKKITLVFSHVNEQPLSMMKKAGFYDKVGAENFCANIDAALERAGKIVK